MIRFEAVRKTFPDGTVAVDDLSLDLDQGALTVFVGPSGCGKTTSMRMINRMVDPSSGRVWVEGRDVRTVEPTGLRLRIGYVIQNAGLMPHRTVVDNVATVLRLKGVGKAESRNRALDAMERVGLPTSMAHKYPAQLSGGQQQRVGVARALAADPPILLMDEPFSAVDPVVRGELQTELRRLQAELRKTIVFVTHDIDEAVLLGDRIAVFGPGGHVEQYADPQTILLRPASSVVARLAGRDRGYRALSFESSRGLPFHEVATLTPQQLQSAQLAHGEWRLVATDGGEPLGWIDAQGVHDLASLGLDGALQPVGSIAKPGDSRRQVLDSALSSPTGVGLVDAGSGQWLGVAAADVVADRAQGGQAS